MPAKPNSPASTEREKLLYFVMLRQLETSSELVRAAYGRLADATSAATGWDPRTVMLDWLEAELKALRQIGEAAGDSGSQLMRATVAFSNALKQ